MLRSYQLSSVKALLEKQLFFQNDCKKLNIENKDLWLSLHTLSIVLILLNDAAVIHFSSKFPGTR